MKQFAIIMMSLLLTACAPSAVNTVTTPTDKLAEIEARGTLVIATDVSYMPQSHLIEDSKPDPGTKCEPTQYTANQFEGFDVEVAVKIAADLGVEACFVAPPWSQLVASSRANSRARPTRFRSRSSSAPWTTIRVTRAT